MNSLLLIFLIWLGVNALFPLFLKSVERQYQRQIDFIVKGLFRIIKIFLIRIVQVAMILLLLPNILIAVLLEKIKTSNPRSIYFWSLYTSFKDLKEALLAKNFPAAFIKGYRIWRENKYKIRF